MKNSQPKPYGVRGIRVFTMPDSTVLPLLLISCANSCHKTFMKGTSCLRMIGLGCGWSQIRKQRCAIALQRRA
jgi:hypothetical protein